MYLHGVGFCKISQLCFTDRNTQSTREIQRSPKCRGFQTLREFEPCCKCLRKRERQRHNPQHCVAEEECRDCCHSPFDTAAFWESRKTCASLFRVPQHVETLKIEIAFHDHKLEVGCHVIFASVILCKLGSSALPDIRHHKNLLQQMVSGSMPLHLSKASQSCGMRGCLPHPCLLRGQRPGSGWKVATPPVWELSKSTYSLNSYRTCKLCVLGIKCEKGKY